MSGLHDVPSLAELQSAKPRPADAEPVNIEDYLTAGAPIIVEMNGVLYDGKVNRPPSHNELSVETAAAKILSPHWQTILFYVESRRSVYGAGTATFAIPGIDPMPKYQEDRRGKRP